MRLLDRGFFRIGTEEYAVTNESYGLATIRKEHVTIAQDTMIFDYPAKSGKRRIQGVVDPLSIDVVGALKRRRGGGPELLAYKAGRTWYDLRSDDINAYLKRGHGRRLLGQGLPHLERDRDRRTRTGGVRPGAGHEDVAQAGDHARHQGDVALSGQHARGLPRLLHRPARVRRLPVGLVLDQGVIQEALEAEAGELPTHHPLIERAVLDLVDGRETAPGVEQIAA